MKKIIIVLCLLIFALSTYAQQTNKNWSASLYTQYGYHQEYQGIDDTDGNFMNYGLGATKHFFKKKLSLKTGMGYFKREQLIEILRTDQNGNPIAPLESRILYEHFQIPIWVGYKTNWFYTDIGINLKYLTTIKNFSEETLLSTIKPVDNKWKTGIYFSVGTYKQLSNKFGIAVGALVESTGKGFRDYYQIGGHLELFYYL